MAKLTEMQERFCQEYIIDLNATQAAIRAGYSEKTAYSQGQRSLKKVEIQAYLQEKMKERAERTEITQDKVLKELALIAFSNAADYARIIEKPVMVEVNGIMVQARDDCGNPVKYRTVEPFLTDELTEDQQKALAVIKEGRNGFEIRTYDKIKALEKLGQHLGMWTSDTDGGNDNDAVMEFIKAMRND